MKLLKGSSRYVFLIGNYAIKIPSLRSYRNFLKGLLHNMQEVQWWFSLKDDRLCPVLFYLPMGFMVVMPKCGEVSNTDWMAKYSEYWKLFDNTAVNYITSKATKKLDFDKKLSESVGIPLIEKKVDSFGWFKGRIVAVDYGD